LRLIHGSCFDKSVFGIEATRKVGVQGSEHWKPITSNILATSVTLSTPMAGAKPVDGLLTLPAVTSDQPYIATGDEPLAWLRASGGRVLGIQR